MNAESLLETVLALEVKARPREKCDRAAVIVESEVLVGFMRRLREEPSLAFDMLYTHTAIDWVAEGRFELIYQLYSLSHNHSLMVSTLIPRDRPVAPSVISLFRIAEWQEREVYDLFGVLYEGHPDLRRLFLEDDWVGFPLRKDYKDDFMLERP